jgi:anti-sigma factor RsiW
MTKCERISKQPELVLDYASGSPDAEFARHLEQCEDCASIAAAQRKVWDSLDQLSAPEVQGDFDARLYARIAQEESRPSWRRWLNRILQPAVPMAAWKPAVAMAALCAVLAIGIMVRTPTPGAPSAIQMNPGASTQVDIEQVANALDELDVLMPSKSVM